MSKKKRNQPRIKLPWEDQEVLRKHAKSEGLSLSEYMQMRDSEMRAEKERIKREKAKNTALNKIIALISTEKIEGLNVIYDIIKAYQKYGLKGVVQCASEKINDSGDDKVKKMPNKNAKFRDSNRTQPANQNSPAIPNAADIEIGKRFEYVKSANIDYESSQNASESKVLSHEAGESKNPNYRIIKCRRRFRRNKINSLYKN